MIEFRRGHRHRPFRPTQPRSHVLRVPMSYAFPCRTRSHVARQPECRTATRKRRASSLRIRRCIYLRVQGGGPGRRGARRWERRSARPESKSDSPFRVCILVLTGEFLSVIQSTKRARQAQLQSVTRRRDRLIGTPPSPDSRMAAANRKQSNASLCHKLAHSGSAACAACSRQSSARLRNRSLRSPATRNPPCIRSSSL